MVATDLTTDIRWYAWTAHAVASGARGAMSIGLAAGGRFPTKDIAPYVGAQVVGAIVASAVLYIIAKGAPGFDLSGGFAANGFGAHSYLKRCRHHNVDGAVLMGTDEDDPEVRRLVRSDVATVGVDLELEPVDHVRGDVGDVDVELLVPPAQLVDRAVLLAQQGVLDR